MAYSSALTQLIDAFRVLPGVGTKTAQRMAFYVLQRDQDGGRQLATAVTHAIDHIHYCGQCRMFTEQALCDICANERRDASRVCVVESPADVIAIEQHTDYRGHYFVLMGHLSPIDGIGPEELGLGLLRERLTCGAAEEMILATSATVEGEATAQYVGDMARAHEITVSRIAHGVPVGGELEYVDAGTLSQAFNGRRPI